MRLCNESEDFEIGYLLRKYRVKSGLTQQYLANCLGISREAYRKWENNNIDFSISQLKRIGLIYNISICNIILESQCKPKLKILY